MTWTRFNWTAPPVRHWKPCTVPIGAVLPCARQTCAYEDLWLSLLSGSLGIIAGAVCFVARGVTIGDWGTVDWAARDAATHAVNALKYAGWVENERADRRRE